MVVKCTDPRENLSQLFSHGNITEKIRIFFLSFNFDRPSEWANLIKYILKNNISFQRASYIQYFPEKVMQTDIGH